MVLKLTVTAFSSLPFWTLWQSWLNFFSHFKTISLWSKKWLKK